MFGRLDEFPVFTNCAECGVEFVAGDEKVNTSRVSTRARCTLHRSCYIAHVQADVETLSVFCYTIDPDVLGWKEQVS